MTGRRLDPASARDPKHYVHGLDGAGVVLVPARVAAWLHANLPLDKLRTEVRGTDPEVDHVLIGLSVAGLNWRAAVSGKKPRQVAAEEPTSPWLTTTEVSDRLDIPPRTVRWACQQGQLRAERVTGHWRISREDFEQYRAAREAA